LKKKALNADLKTPVLFLKKPIRKNDDIPKPSQESSRRIQLLDKTKKTMLIIKKFNCTKNLSL
jgi:hypothetical protein